MESRQHLFIYDRREVVVLILLGVLVAVFAFTLGLHLGQQVATKPAAVEASGSHPAVEALPDQTPHAREFQEQPVGNAKATEEALNQALHDEVARTGIKLDVGRQVDLPDKTHREKAQGKAGEGAGGAAPEAPTKDVLVEDLEALRRVAPTGEFTLEVGTPRAGQDARDQIEALEALGLKPWLRVSAAAEKSVIYHVYLGGFSSKDAAEAAGQKYRGKHMIESFEVVKMPRRAEEGREAVSGTPSKSE